MMRKIQFLELAEHETKLLGQLQPDTLIVVSRASMRIKDEAFVSTHSYAVFEPNELGELYSVGYFDFDMIPPLKEAVKLQGRVQAAKQFYLGNERLSPHDILQTLNVLFTTYTYKQWQDRNAQA